MMTTDAPPGGQHAELTPQPLYGQVRQILLDAIRKGQWMVGDPMPNEATLAKRFGVSIGTIRRAVADLEENGLVKRIQGRGTYVAGIGSHVLKTKFTPLKSIKDRSAQLEYQLISLTTVAYPGGRTTGHGKATDRKSFEIQQIVSFASEPVGLEISHVGVDHLPNLATQCTYGQHLYPLFSDYGIIVTRRDDELSVGRACPAVAALLNLSEGDPVLEVAATAYSLDGIAVETRIAYYAGDRVTYAARVD